MATRLAVIVPCHDDGVLVAEAVHSVREEEPLEVVVVDDASSDEETRETLERVEHEGVSVLRLEENCGVGNARMTGLAVTSAPFVFPLDADDEAIPGVMACMADALEAHPEAAACVGDVVEFGEHDLTRLTPARLDPYRVAYTNEYPITALFRRSALVVARAWERHWVRQGYEDWNLWMSLAERGEQIVHLGGPVYRRRLHGRRLNQKTREAHREHYEAMRRLHPDLFKRLPQYRRESDLPLLRRVLYPLLFGARAEVPFERTLKPWFDRLGIWTRTAPRSGGGRRKRRRGQEFSNGPLSATRPR
jgi:glycosyltransferase involved in cell wall biosynthesis